MKMAAIQKLKIPAELKRPFGTALACELMLIGHEGAVPPELEPLFEQVYDEIGARKPIGLVNASLKRLLRVLEGRES